MLNCLMTTLDYTRGTENTTIYNLVFVLAYSSLAECCALLSGCLAANSGTMTAILLLWRPTLPSSFGCSVVSNFLQSHRLEPDRLLCPWDSPGKNTGGDCHSLLQRIFLTQGSNPGLLRCRQILYCFSFREDIPNLEPVHCSNKPLILLDFICPTRSVSPRENITDEIPLVN